MSGLVTEQAREHLVRLTLVDRVTILRFLRLRRQNLGVTNSKNLLSVDHPSRRLRLLVVSERLRTTPNRGIQLKQEVLDLPVGLRAHQVSISLKITFILESMRFVSNNVPCI